MHLQKLDVLPIQIAHRKGRALMPCALIFASKLTCAVWIRNVKWKIINPFASKVPGIPEANIFQLLLTFLNLQCVNAKLNQTAVEASSVMDATVFHVSRSGVVQNTKFN